MPSPWRNAIALVTALGTRFSAKIAAFSASHQRRRCGAPVKTSTHRKLCLSISKLLGAQTPASTNQGSNHSM